MGEVRYNSLSLRFPERAEELFEIEEMAKGRFEHLKALQQSYETKTEEN
ncbi:MAG: hypothetical protein ACLTK0_02060 [Anaerovoracaceae bacterium]